MAGEGNEYIHCIPFRTQKCTICVWLQDFRRLFPSRHKKSRVGLETGGYFLPSRSISNGISDVVHFFLSIWMRFFVCEGVCQLEFSKNLSRADIWNAIYEPGLLWVNQVHKEHSK